ncbi:class I SAM-dependent methyltransferase [Pedobacter aquatilis]|uniref:class I SAM-dependent methyltransferase n=1 Tax=Pedobacter aquatilis TaxID=351343 RepID=UPI00292EB1B6|nr:class I SAM-dependent methyltransferase [Pedobacter aquatilis]
MKKIISALFFLYRKIYFKLQCILFNKIINSKNAWLIFDKSNIPGFGTNLLRTYFPIYSTQSFKESFSSKVISMMEEVIKRNKAAELELKIINEMHQLLELSEIEKDQIKPYLDNYFFGIFDAAILGAMMQQYIPLKIIEIGSGISTRYMHFFKNKYSLKTKITCIDPFPRVEIEQVVDTFYKKPLESAIEENEIQLAAGDFLFMDGSHYAFQGNDTLTFFFKLIPSIPSGVIIHIHDIYLPYDYDTNVSQQLWAEQYILAAMLVNGLKDYEILYPAYYESCTNQQIINKLNEVNLTLGSRNFEKRKSHKEGYSFWMRKK